MARRDGRKCARAQAQTRLPSRSARETTALRLARDSMNDAEMWPERTEKSAMPIVMKIIARMRPGGLVGTLSP